MGPRALWAEKARKSQPSVPTSMPMWERGLGRVDEDLCAGVGGEGGHLSYRIDGPEGVRGEADGDHPDLRAEEFFVGLHVDFARVGDGDLLDERALLLARDLPGHDVRVVLHRRDKDVVAPPEEALAEGGGGQVDGVRRAAGKDDLLRDLGADKAPGTGTGPLVGVGPPLREVVDAPVDVGRVVAVVAVDGFEDGLGFGGGSGVVEVDERHVPDPAGQLGKVAPYLLDVEAHGAAPPSLCSTIRLRRGLDISPAISETKARARRRMALSSGIALLAR